MLLRSNDKNRSNPATLATLIFCEMGPKARTEARKADKMEYLEDVKAIIGPDQYVVFLEYFYVNGGRNQNGNKAIRQGKDGHKDMAHHKGMKGQRKGGDRKGNRNATAGNAQS